MNKLADRAREILRMNDRGGYTVPSARLYPHQWAWDSAFAAMGWAHVDLGRAVRELETLLAGQWPDGRVPHIIFHLEGNYFPDVAFWGTAGAGPCRSTSITQPPVWASAARMLHERGADVRRMMDALERSHLFFHSARDPLGWGCVAVVHPWESGLDNSPAWDGALRHVDPAKAPPFKRIDVTIGDASQRPHDDEYRRYAVLVKAIADDGFGPGPFAVYDPLMTAVLARAERDLAWLQASLQVPGDAAARATRIQSGLMAHLWDEVAGRFHFYDARAGAAHCPDVLPAYLPLIAGLPVEVETRLLATLRARYWTPYPLPSTAPDDPAFEPNRYWRGPVWVNTNWFLEPFFPELRERTLALLEEKGFWEYFNPYTGDGLGAENFTWSAALALCWLA